MRILLTGGTGQLGWELRRTLAPRGEISAPGRDLLDLRDPDAIRDAVRKVQPDLVVNAAAYNDVDRAEAETEGAFAVNAEAPHLLAREAGRAGAALIHYSTDYVFRGDRDEPYPEDAEPDPVNAYGRSKRQGELAVLDAGVPCLVFRLSWVYGPRRTNFVNTMLRLFRDRKTLRVVDDQWGSPTWCRTAAEVTAQVLASISAEHRELAGGIRERGGLYHLAARGRVSRHEQARAIQRHAHRLRPEAGYDRCAIQAIPTSEYPTEAARPRSTPLSSSRLEQSFGLSLPGWEEELVRCLEDRFQGD